MSNDRNTAIESYILGNFDVIAVVAISILLLAGCGGGKSANRAQVTGRVTVDGKAPESGSIAFSPVDGASPTAGGKLIDGSFFVEVPLGLAKVSIRVPKVVGEKKLYGTADSPTRTVKAESLPAKFNDETELTLEVVPGINQHDFEISTK